MRRAAPERRARSKRHRRNRERSVRRRAAGRQRRRVERRAHREEPERHDRRGGAVQDRRPASRCVHRDVFARRVPDRQAAERRAADRFHGDDQRRDERRRDRGIGDGVGGVAGGGRAKRVAHAGAQSRGDGRDPDRPDDSGPRATHRRRQSEPAGHRRRARDAADLHVDARPVGREQHRDGGRHDGERPDVGWGRPKLLQRRDEPGGRVSDERHRRRDVGGRRAAQHDPERRRQPVQRILQRCVSPRKMAGRQPQRSTQDRAPGVRTGGARSHRRERDRSDSGLHRRRGRADSQEQAVVLRLRPSLLREQLHRADVHEGRRTRGRRSVHQEHHGADHLADQPPQQVLRVQRRNRQVPRPRHAGAVRPRYRGDRLELAGVSHQPGEVDVDRDQQADDRRRVLEQSGVLHQRIP